MPDPPFEFFFDFTQPQRPPTEKVLKVNMSFHDSVKKKIKNSEESDISPQIIELKRLEDSAVIFQALETSPASLTSVASTTSLASKASKAQFTQKTS